MCRGPTHMHDMSHVQPKWGICSKNSSYLLSLYVMVSEVYMWLSIVLFPVSSETPQAAASSQCDTEIIAPTNDYNGNSLVWYNFYGVQRSWEECLGLYPWENVGRQNNCWVIVTAYKTVMVLEPAHKQLLVQYKQIIRLLQYFVQNLKYTYGSGGYGWGR